MSTASPVTDLDQLHPAIWRASQLARSTTRCIDTGHLSLSNQLVGGGWPTATLIELLTQQAGSGEMRLLAPALAQVAKRKIVMIDPPHSPNSLALARYGIAPQDNLWVKSKSTGDALWAAEHVLRSASCGAVLFWLKQVRPESLRRLHLAAQSGETLFFVLRPLAAAQDASPSPLRLSLRPAPSGIEIGFVKRKGPQRDDTLFLPLEVMHGRPQVQTPIPERDITVPSDDIRAFEREKA